MKIQFVNTFIKGILFSGLLAAIVFLSSASSAAQTKRAVDSEKDFFVPCAKALRIGLSEVQKLHSKDMERQTKGNSDSDTELLETQGAMKNYISCRRADTAARLKKLTADEKKQFNLKSENARQIARMRVDLIPYISFDENFEDPLDYTITQKAIALVEDYKVGLTGVYKQTKDAAPEKQIGELLARIEKISREADEATEFSSFKKAVEKALKENGKGTEKVVTTAFLVRLLKMNLPGGN